MKSYSSQQLSLKNGQDHEEVWVAYNGYIYDVTESRMWRKGRHYEHWAGQDLTNEINEAPHLPEVLNKFEIIGKLKS